MCEAVLSIRRKPHPQGRKKLSWKWLRSTLYTTWGWPQHRSNSCALSPQSNPTFSTLCGSNFATCKVMRPNFRSPCSQEENVVKTINLSWTDNRDVHYSMNVPNPTRVVSSGWGEARPYFFKLAWRFDANIVPPKTPREMSECSNPFLV